MPTIVATDIQTSWKDSYASSSPIGLTLRANGEEPVEVYTTTKSLVPAGFEAPTVAPTVADGGAGVLPAGYCAYAYVYASSQYPGVNAVITAGGFLYPKSNPSPASSVYTITANHQNIVTVTKSERSDSDIIFIYRTTIVDTSAQALALAVAGEMNYVGFVEDNAVPGTTIFTDNVAQGAEQMELDNYPAPQFWKTVFETPYWWGFGNPELIVQVTLDGVETITAPAGTFFSGRINQQVTFDGITSGGFDGNGTFYFRYVTDSVANVALTPDGAAAGLPASGVTTMHVRGPASTLYRSKPNNPFAWGVTKFNFEGNEVTRTPEQYAVTVGGRGSALAVMTTERLLKLDCENPNVSYVFNLNAAGTDGFESTKRRLDGQYSIAAHDSQFYVTLPDGSTALAGIDASNTAVTLANAAAQTRFGSEVVNTVSRMITTDNYPRQFHGVFDPKTELSTFFIKTVEDPDNLVDIDTALHFHGPSGQWSTSRLFDITASASVYDPVTLETLTLVGTKNGKLGKAFSEESWSQMVVNYPLPRSFDILAPRKERDGFTFNGDPFGPTPAAGTYFDIGDTEGTVRVWLNSASNPVQPPIVPVPGRLLEIPNAIDNGDLQTMVSNIAASFDSAFNVLSVGQVDMVWEVVLPGRVPPFNTGTIGDVDMTLTQQLAGTNGVNMDYQLDPGAWALFVATHQDGEPLGTYIDLWMCADTLGEFNQAITLDPVTNSVNTLTFGEGLSGTCYIGVINCEARTYFPTSEKNSGQIKEVWANFDGGLPIFQYYEWFNNNPYLPPFSMQVTSDQVGNQSSNWVARNVPSVLNKQFGLKMIERGYDGFEVRTIDVLRKESRG